MPIDVYRAQANRFQIIDGKLMPSFSAIDGLGEKAAESIVEAAAKVPFYLKMTLEQERKSIKQWWIS